MKKWMMGCFWGLLLLPNLFWLAFSSFFTGENTENRLLAQFPVFTGENLQEFPGEIESYINDHAAFRAQFLSLNSGINLAVFHSVDNGEVIRGQDGWYFYGGGTSVADYRGQNLFTEEELAVIASGIERTRLYYESLGIQFAVILAPNKEEIYSEYMPSWYTRLSSITRYDQLELLLREQTGALVIAPKAYFLAHKKDRLWYFKTDTHWNEAGGFVAGQMLIHALGGQTASPGEVEILYQYRGPGDLARLFHMPACFNEDYLCTIENYYDEVMVEESVKPMGTGFINHTIAENAPDRRKIAFYRDSFAMLMMEEISKYFHQADYYYWYDFQRECLEENLPDILVYEVVEREFIRISDDMDKLVPEGWEPTLSAGK